MKKNLLFSFVAFSLLTHLVVAQNTITMPREGSMSKELQPCITYTILDPGGTGNYPAGSSSSLFLCAPAGSTITINGSYQLAGAESASGIGHDAHASITIFEGELMREDQGSSHMVRNYPFCDNCNPPIVGSYNNGILSGNISYTSDSSCIAIFFQSKEDATTASGFQLTVNVSSPIGNNPFIQNVTVINLNDRSATFRWDRLQGNPGRGHVELLCSPNSDFIGASPISTTTNTATNINITGLQPATTYYYRLRKSTNPSSCDEVKGTITTMAAPSDGSCVDFTDLDGPYAQCYYGNYANPKLHKGKIDQGEGKDSRHTVFTYRRHDSRATKPGDTLWTIPKGANASVRLGNWQIGAQSENITYQYTVDTTKFDVLQLKYAVVLQNPNHHFPNQPMFTLKVTDVLGNVLDSNCYYAHFVPDSNTNDWHQTPSAGGTTIVWKDWASIGVNLAPLHGQTIFVSLSTHDCNETQHYGYAYFTLSCERKKVEISSCGNTIENRFTMPDGFAYRWYKKGSPSNTLSRERTYHANATSEGVYMCELSFLGANSNMSPCSFTMSVTAQPHFPIASFEMVKNGSVGCDTRFTLVNNSYIATNTSGTGRINTNERMDYRWFVDNEPVGDDLSEVVLSSGYHKVSLEVSLANGQCTNTKDNSIEVDRGPCEEYEDFVCLFEDEVHMWRGKSFRESGVYRDTTYRNNAIDSIFTLTLEVYPKYNVRVDDTICGVVNNNYSTEVHSDWHHNDTLPTIDYCDSIISHYLTVNPITKRLNVRDTVENGLPYSFLGKNFHGPKDTTFTLVGQNSHGCDSIIDFRLNVCYNSAETLTRNVCDNNFPYNWNRDGSAHQFSAAGRQYDTIRNHCGADSVITLVVNEKQRSYYTFNKTACNSFTWTGKTNKTYRQSCDTAKYTIRNGNAAGCDSIITLNLTIDTNTTGIDSVTACDSYWWNHNGRNYTQTPTTPPQKKLSIRNAKGCDTTVILHLTINRKSEGVDTQIACIEYTWVNGQRYTSSTTSWSLSNRPKHTYPNANAVGCDSVVSLYLTINNKKVVNDNKTACDSLVWHNTVYKNSVSRSQGIKFDTVDSKNCDSTTYLILTIDRSTQKNDPHTVCDSFVWQANGRVYLTSNNTDTVHLRTRKNCDSLVNLNLTVNYKSEGSENQNECDSYIWHGRRFTSSTDTATYHSLNSKNCDSTTTLHLTIRYSSDSTENITACYRYTWNGREFSSTNDTATYHTTNAVNCDSTVYLKLTINDSTVVHAPYTQCDSFEWHGVTYFADNHTASHRDTSVLGCDSITILDLTINHSNSGTDTKVACDSLEWHGTTYRESNNSATHLTPNGNVKNCDSTTMLHLKINPSYRQDYYDTICDNETAERSGETFDSEGLHTVRLFSIHNCDSIEDLHLKVWPTFTTPDPHSICSDSCLLWQDGNNYSSIVEPTPQKTYRSEHNCDSTVTLVLSILDLSYHNIDSLIVQNALPFTFNEVTFPDVIDTVFHFTNIVGCDSSLHFTLRVCRNDTVHLFDTICDNQFPHEWETLRFDSIGIQNRVIHTSCGSDSVLILHLSQFPTYRADFYDTICANKTSTRSGETFNTEDTHLVMLRTMHNCDSAEYLHLKVWPTYVHPDPKSICRGDTLTWHSVKYTDILTPAPDTLYRSQHNCDSTVTLDLSIRELSYTRIDSLIVENALPFHYNDATFEDEGDSVFHFTNAVGCDSSVDFTLRVCRNRTVDLYDTICDNRFPHRWYSRTFDTIGILNDTVHTSCGADSVLVLHLAQFPTYDSNFFDTICDNQTFTQSGETFNTEDTHLVMLRTMHNCDSAEYLHLKVWPTFSHTDPQSICRRDTLLWQDSNRYTDIVYPAPYVVYRSEHTCDSTVTLALSIRELSFNSEHVVVAENDLPYHYNDATFGDDADTVFTLTNAVNCDSFLHFTLYVCRNRIVDLYDTICDNTFPHRWYSRTFDTIGQLYDTVHTFCGADSILTLHLEQKPTYRYDYYDTICDNQTASQSGHTFNTNGIHRVMLQTMRGCDSAEDLNLKVWPTFFHYDSIAICRGDTLLWQDDSSYIDIVLPAPYMDYYSEHGCDSTVTLVLTVNELSYNTVHVVVAESDMPTYRYNGAAFIDDVEDTVFILTNAVNCDSIVHFSLYVCRNREAAFYDTICDNHFPHIWNEQHFDTIGQITYIIPTFCDADSIITLHLAQHPTYRFDYYDTICDNQTATQSGHTFSTNGIHRVMLQTIRQCDSAEDLNLKVWPTFFHYDPISICRGDTLLWQDDSNYLDIVTPAPFVIYRSEHDCDSTVTLKLKVNELSYNSESVIVTENDLPTYRYNEAGFATDVEDTVFILTNAVGCDSILHFSLYVCRNVDSSAYREVCDDVLPLNWNDTTFEHGGLLTLHRTNWCGADSTVYLTVKVHRTYLNKHYDTICDNQHSFWENQVFTTTGTYNMYYQSIYACDSTERLYLKVHPTYDDTDHIVLCWGKSLRWIDSINYSYRPIDDPKVYMQSIYGCDSIRTLDIIKTHPIGSDLFVEPEHPSWENPEIQITDISRNVCRREWYISGRFLDTSQTVTYHFNSSDVEALIKLVIFDNYGCVDTVTRRIHFDRAGLWVTNIFTPNRFENSVMRIGGEDINELECYVYTRQGQFVYKFNSINDTWDGTFHGTPCPQGTYTYVIRYNSIHDPKSWLTKVGTVTLLR